MSKMVKSAMAVGVVVVPALFMGAQSALADCEFRINLLGDRILRMDQKTAGEAKSGESPSRPVEAIEQKLKEMTGDVKEGARGRDITEDRMATAKEPGAGATVPESEAAKSGVVHSDPGSRIIEPESSDPLTRAKNYWRQARELNAKGARKVCATAVKKANVELDKIKN